MQNLLAKFRLPADHTRTEPAQSDENYRDKTVQLYDELRKLAPADVAFNRQALRNKEKST